MAINVQNHLDQKLDQLRRWLPLKKIKKNSDVGYLRSYSTLFWMNLETYTYKANVTSPFFFSINCFCLIYIE